MSSHSADESRPLGIAVLGSTGSVGRQTLDVIDAHPDKFRVVSLAARSPSRAFFEQVRRHQPTIATLADFVGSPIPGALRTLSGPEGLQEAATAADVDIVVVATSGHDAIVPTMRAIEHGKTIALANKEALVCAGELIMPLANHYGVEIRPVDSEHSAVWQALGNAPKSDVRRIILTASGGPFRTTPSDEMARVTVGDALAHPTWSMGGKITIDSATMMNKGLEVIEAHWLFGVTYEQIDVLVHPESTIHSIVEFNDGSHIAQLGLPDMRLPIQYALSYPARLSRSDARLDLAALGSLHFELPDESRFPCLSLARQAGAAGGSYPTVLSASDDEAVDAFAQGRIRFIDIPAVIQRVLDRHVPVKQLSLESILHADAWARNESRSVIADM